MKTDRRSFLKFSALSLMISLSSLWGCKSVSDLSEDKARGRELKGEFDLMDRPFQKKPTSGCYLATKIKFEKNAEGTLATLTQKHVGPCPHIMVFIEPRNFQLGNVEVVPCNLRMYAGKGLGPSSAETISITDNRNRDRSCQEGLGDITVSIKVGEGKEQNFYTPEKSLF